MSRYQPVRARVAGAEEPKEVHAGEDRLLARDVLQYARECDRQTAKRQNQRAVADEAGEEARGQAAEAGREWGYGETRGD